MSTFFAGNTPRKSVSEPTRRDMLYIMTASFAAVGTAAVAWPLIDEMNPDAAALAAGAPIDINIKALEPGQQMVVKWRGSPMLVVRRSQESLKQLESPALTQQLLDPESDVLQQPHYAQNWHRSAKPEVAVYVGVCTHLGCVPAFFPKPSDSVPVKAWEGGFFCPCHGSKYDLAGRVFKGVPAPYNLPVPPYRMVSNDVLRIGENPPGQDFEMSSIVQM